MYVCTLVLREPKSFQQRIDVIRNIDRKENFLCNVCSHKSQVVVEYVEQMTLEAMVVKHENRLYPQ